MNEIDVDIDLFKKIQSGKQNMIILKEQNLEKEEDIIIKNEKNSEKILARITGKNEFKTFQDIIKVIPIELLGNIELYKNIRDTIFVYRIQTNIKFDIKAIIKDKKIYELLDFDNLEEIKIGRSISKVFKGRLKKNNQEVIFKVQFLPSRSSLTDEYIRLKWIYNKINSPEVYYWNEEDEDKYLIMELKKGIPAFKFNNIGYRLGKELKKIHSIDISKCEFCNNSTEKLISNFMDKVDNIYPELEKSYPGETKESLIKFIIENEPKDKVLIHGDYSLPNILIDENDIYNFIDLGDISVSSKYFDFYYFIRSLKINKKQDMLKDFLAGYGIENLEGKYLKWMDIIDKSLY